MKTWWSRIHRRGRVLRQLRGAAEWWLFLRALFFAAGVPLLMRLNLPRLGWLLEPRAARAIGSPAARPRPERVVRCVESAIAFGAPLVRPKCLTRGLTLYYFLRRAGLDLRLCFGTSWQGGRLSGHCWLAKDGAPFLEENDPRVTYAPIYALPEGPSQRDGPSGENSPHPPPPG